MTGSHRDFVDAVIRATPAIEARPATKHPPLASASIAELGQVFRRDLPSFGDRALDATITDAGAKFFSRIRILRLESAIPFPAQAAYAAWLGTGPVVLTGNPEALHAVNAEERSAVAADPDLAIALAGIVGTWIGASRLLEIRLRDVDDIPFRRANDEDREREAELRRVFASRIEPPGAVRIGDGVRVTMWIVSESRLRLRQVEVGVRGLLATEEVLADVPAFPGAMWAMRNGRFVPIG